MAYWNKHDSGLSSIPFLSRIDRCNFSSCKQSLPLEDTYVERFWTVILNAYKKRHEINNSERIPETSYAISIFLPLRYQADNNFPCIKSLTVLFNWYNYFSDPSPLQNFKVKRNLVTWT